MRAAARQLLVNHPEVLLVYVCKQLSCTIDELLDTFWPTEVDELYRWAAEELDSLEYHRN
jgi:hypothetical protein